MKKFYLIALVCMLGSFTFAKSQSIVVYDGEELSPIWENLVSSVTNNVDNPDKSGINTSDKCASMVRRGNNVFVEDYDGREGKETWSGGRLYGLNFSPYYFNRISIMVKKSINGRVKIELQRATGEDGRGEEDKEGIDAVEHYTGNGTWQQLVFKVNCRDADINNFLIFLHDEAVSDDFEDTMYWDNLVFYYEPNFPVNKGVMTLYNGEDVDTWWHDLASTLNRKVENPDKAGVNKSDYCVSIVRNNSGTDAGGHDFSGGALWGCEKVRIDPAEFDKLSIMVKKPVTGNVTLELQRDGVDNQFVSAWYSEDNLNEWQKLDFDISSRMEEIHKILVRPHDTNDGLTSEGILMYWDNLIAYDSDELSSNYTVTFNDKEIKESLIYSITGSFIGKNTAINTLQKGIYIIKQIDVDGNSHVSKIHKQ